MNSKNLVAFVIGVVITFFGYTFYNGLIKSPEIKWNQQAHDIKVDNASVTITTNFPGRQIIFVHRVSRSSLPEILRIGDFLKISEDSTVLTYEENTVSMYSPKNKSDIVFMFK